MASSICPSQQSCSSRWKGRFLQQPWPDFSIIWPPQHPWYILVKTTGTSRETTLQQPFVSRSYGTAPQQAFGWWMRSVCRRSVLGGPEDKNVKLSTSQTGSVKRSFHWYGGIWLRHQDRLIVGEITGGPWKPPHTSILKVAPTTATVTARDTTTQLGWIVRIN